MIAFYVQGGGLGHLARTHKLIQELQIDIREVLIISPSQFKHHFKQYQFIELSWQDRPDVWSNTLMQQLKNKNISECYIDTFPLGIKGELIAVYKELANISFHYVSRILKWEKYLQAMPEVFAPEFTKTILLETLYDAHLAWIQQTSIAVTSTQLPITPIEKHKKLTAEPYVLVIHSGGKQNVIRICKKVRSLLEDKTTPVFVFTQVEISLSDKTFHLRTNEHPIQHYFKYATHIYTAAGFNLMHELAPFRAKHTALPIDRMFDDQFFRAQNRTPLHLK